MKKMRWLALALVLVLGLGVFSACGSGAKVKFYDGKTLLKTEKVEKGANVASWTPDAKEGKEFVNWYVDEGLNRLFDFNGEKINEDKDLYAGYATVGTEDARTWAIVGMGKGEVMASSNWGKVIGDIHKLQKVEGKNEFTFTVDLYKGDQFQFATNTDWLNQRGVGYIATFNMAGNVGGQTKTAFSGGGGLGETADKQKNVIVEEAGNYTFTLKTYIDEDFYDDKVNGGKVSINKFDSITWKHNGAAAELPDGYLDFYIKGDKITGWRDIQNDATRMKRIGKDYEMTLFLQADDKFTFRSVNVNSETGEETAGTDFIKSEQLDDASKALFKSEKGDLVPKASGNYTFKYNDDTKKLIVTFEEGAMVEMDYYLDGKINTSNWQDYPKTDDNYDYKLVKQTDGTYLIENVVFKTGDQFMLREFAKDTVPSKGATNVPYNYKYFVGTKDILDAADEEANNYNIAVVEAGTYSIKFDPYSKIITLDRDTLYIKGSFADGWKITDADGKLIDDYKLTETTKGKFEITMTVTAEMVAGDKSWQGMLMLNTTNGNDGTPLGVSNLSADSADNANALFRPATGTNLTCKTAGKYKFVYEKATNKISIFTVTDTPEA